MEKLIFRHSWGDMTCTGNSLYPFEYESKEKFLFDIFEKYKNHKWIDNYSSITIEEFGGLWLEKYDFDNIEYNIFTFEEWFEKNKTNILCKSIDDYGKS